MKYSTGKHEALTAVELWGSDKWPQPQPVPTQRDQRCSSSSSASISPLARAVKAANIWSVLRKGKNYALLNRKHFICYCRDTSFFFLKKNYDKNQRPPPNPPKTAELLLVIYNHSYHIKGNFDDYVLSEYISSVLMRTGILEVHKQSAEVRNLLSRSPKRSAGEGDGSGEGERGGRRSLCSPIPQVPSDLPKFITKFVTVNSLEVSPPLERTRMGLRNRVGLSVPAQMLLRQQEMEKNLLLENSCWSIRNESGGKSREVSSGFSRGGCMVRMDGWEEQE